MYENRKFHAWPRLGPISAIDSIYLYEVRASAFQRAFPPRESPEFENLLAPLSMALTQDKRLQRIASRVDSEDMFDRWTIAMQRIDYIFCHSFPLSVMTIVEEIADMHQILVSSSFEFFILRFR